MKHQTSIFLIVILLSSSCTTQKKISYLNNLPEIGGEETFAVEIPEYRIQQRDILYITIKAITPDGSIADFLSLMHGTGSLTYTQSEAGQYLNGYDVNSNGEIILPVIGSLNVGGRTLEEARSIIQKASVKHFNNATVDCKLLSFKFTVIGEVRSPGTYINYNNYLTVLEAIGRAGGINDFGKRDRILVVRPIDKGTKTYTLNLQDKSIINSEAYFLLPNDLVIVEAQKHKIFNMNLPTISFILSGITSVITTTLLLINYFE